MRYSTYLIHYNHNHDRLGRFARSVGGAASSVGDKVTNKKKKARPPKVDIKKKSQGKSANTKLSESEKNRIVKSGTAKEVAKYKDRLSTRDLETAVNRLQQEKIKRIDLDKKLSDLTTDQKKKGITLEKIEKYSSDLERISDSIDKASKMYNTAAKIHNMMTTSESQWPIYGEKKKKETKKYNPDKKTRKLIDTATVEEVYKKRGSLSTAEYNEAIKRRENDAKALKLIREEEERKKGKK